MHACTCNIRLTGMVKCRTSISEVVDSSKAPVHVSMCVYACVWGVHVRVRLRCACAWASVSRCFVEGPWGPHYTMCHTQERVETHICIRENRSAPPDPTPRSRQRSVVEEAMAAVVCACVRVCVCLSEHACVCVCVGLSEGACVWWWVWGAAVEPERAVPDSRKCMRSLSTGSHAHPSSLTLALPTIEIAPPLRAWLLLQSMHLRVVFGREGSTLVTSHSGRVGVRGYVPGFLECRSVCGCVIVSLEHLKAAQQSFHPDGNSTGTTTCGVRVRHSSTHPQRSDVAELVWLICRGVEGVCRFRYLAWRAEVRVGAPLQDLTHIHTYTRTHRPSIRGGCLVAVEGDLAVSPGKPYAYVRASAQTHTVATDLLSTLVRDMAGRSTSAYSPTRRRSRCHHFR
jgi:hypothetical protein